MEFTNSTYDLDGTCDGHGDEKSDQSILESLRDMVQRADPRGAYSFEPTWRIKRVSISQCNTPDPSHAAKPTKPVETPTQPRMPSSAFRERLVTLRSPELREIIMNASLKYFETHKEVVKILKRMQSKKPRPITKGGRVRRPTAGLYLYCRTQGELVDIIFELVGQDVTGCIEQDAKDLITILEEKGDGVSDLA